MNLEKHFNKFRKNIAGIDKEFDSSYGRKKRIYADWIASGRLYEPIEKKLLKVFGPSVGNTHTETTFTGTAMTKSYHHAKQIIKNHCNAGKDDVIINFASGMTGVISKFQRILGLRIPEQIQPYTIIPESEKPIVFITHMEHHSNQTSWVESIADVVIVPPDENGLVSLENFESKIEYFKERKNKIASITACSNVTGIETPYHDIAKLIHKFNGICFVDFACSAPYVKIDMHPQDPEQKLDAIFFSPHKFLGGPGTTGVLIFDSKLYKNKIPDQPGGGTVDWTNPWGQHRYIKDIEHREDGGTPPFLQTIKTALAIKLKEKMDPQKIRAREEELLTLAFNKLAKINKLHILAGNIKHRLGVLSFYVENLHYNLMVKLLNDRFGIQTRGGCSCAGTYGHILLSVCPLESRMITDKIDDGDLSGKPGWVRLSIHPTMTDNELIYICNAIEQIIKKSDKWGRDYIYDIHSNEFKHRKQNDRKIFPVEKWFEL
ncbi:MAG: aminotransferase class V-fold PLP-dependent enzyme [Ignavibacteriales bacterium]|nr:aminotransferase class V-fold PLP-dependent enzyme [Ignavibacteriales bacterium]